MSTSLQLERYATQAARWPASGKVVMGQFDESSIVVYQAFRPDIATEAVRLQRFGARFSRNRMSWIKPGFLWMMCRSSWATAVDQEAVLAIRVHRAFFDRAIESAVPSVQGEFADVAGWAQALRDSDVRAQWDPDHTPDGTPCARRVIQIGLRGEMLREYAAQAIQRIEDITPWVRVASAHNQPPFAALDTPREDAYLTA